MRTGMRSTKPKDINYHDAVLDPDTRLVFIQSAYRISSKQINLFSIQLRRFTEVARNYQRFCTSYHFVYQEDALCPEIHRQGDAICVEGQCLLSACR